MQEELLKNGTLGGGCYASIHGHTVDLAHKHFLGEFIRISSNLKENSS